MNEEISQGFEEETMEAKARWFQSLSMPERMEMLCQFTNLILDINPGIVEKKDVRSITGRIRVLEKA
ncbi:MAG: hypothetical protein KAW12_11465 [Candidatus Aminicenantes bacterium]|nr:hypothetical protein [Candidatus Aminicenantes bacterium]